MRQQGTIYARGDSLWVYYYARGDRRKSVAKLLGKDPGRVTWTEATDALTRCLKDKAKHAALGTLLPPRDEKLTVATLLAEYHAHRTVQGIKRPVAFAQDIKQLTTWWGHLCAARLTTEALEAEVQGKLGAGFARGTIKMRLGGLYAALRWARARLPRIPEAPKVTVPPTPRASWTAEEVARLCAEARPWLAAVARFGYLTGWRISECLGLTWDRVDLRRELLFLDDTKSGDPRVRPIEPALAAVLRGRLECRQLNSALVFHVDGMPIGGDRFYMAWGQALQKAKLDRRRFHSFRGNAYDQLLLNGVNLLDCMDLIGHRSLSSARRYARPSVDRMRAALERRDAAAPHTGYTAPATIVPFSR
jgi:integrase